MGMSSYILDLEEQFDTKVEEAVKQSECVEEAVDLCMKHSCLLYTSPSPRDRQKSRMPSSA